MGGDQTCRAGMLAAQHRGAAVDFWASRAGINGQCHQKLKVHPFKLVKHLTQVMLPAHGCKPTAEVHLVSERHRAAVGTGLHLLLASRSAPQWIARRLKPYCMNRHVNVLVKRHGCRNSMYRDLFCAECALSKK